MAKLTLSIDPKAVARAKRYARSQGTSVSKMVQVYLGMVSEPVETPEPPVLRSLRGILKKGAVRDYRKYLARKLR